MNHSVRLCLVLHNHQPIGNFNGVIDQAFHESYLPFLNVLEDCPGIHLTLHTSGPLLQWMVKHQPDYVRRVSALVAAGRVEILGGPMYESILTMLPSRDRVGQIYTYTNYLAEIFGTEVSGMWVPERVWESSLTADIVRAGIRYTLLDDYHFLSAGWSQDSLAGCFVTEDDGHVLRVFAGCERLRYLIPFADVEESINYARNVAQTQPDAILVCGDDGEKFGTWPNTHHHVYHQGWLRRFFDALSANQDWLKTCTLAEAISEVPPRGKVYLPDCSYREMTEWALPARQQQLYHELTEEFQHHPNWDNLRQFVRAGNWRNFKSRYTEANEMYSRMMQVSRKLDDAGRCCGDVEILTQIEDHLYRGQCNCAYWHGAFGGIYLPHLRNAIYSELIAADNKLDYLEHGHGHWVEATCDDFNFDLKSEVRIANDQFVLYAAPAEGGMIYELDVRSNRHNLLATMQRRPEAYHQKISGQHSEGDHGFAESIHDRIVFKQQGLDQRLQYDKYPRKSFLDHFYDNDVSFEAVTSGSAMERGDFVASAFEAKLRRAANKVQLQMSRAGNAWGVPFRITKALTIQAGSSNIDVAYLIEGLPQDRTFHLACEWNFAGLPAGAEDRYFYNASGDRLGHLGSQLDLQGQDQLGLIDCWLGIDINLKFDRPTALWSFPIETVSQSEAGFELVHQSVSLQPHWFISGDREGKWSMQMQVQIAKRHQPLVLAPHIIQTGVNNLSQFVH
ncbi:MAG: alpha-amylase/4-alpha-glucanotransferase domain-containing protein [Pirellulales bacterium]